MKRWMVAGVAAGMLFSTSGVATAAGSWHNEPLPSNTPMSELTVAASDGQTAWTFGVGANGGDETSAYRRDDRGWQPVAIPDIGTPWAAAALSPNDAWVTGDSTAAHWDGQKWTKVAYVRPSDSTVIRGVDGLGSDDVWAAGQVTPYDSTWSRGTVQHWDGTRWSETPLPRLGSQWWYLWGIDEIAPNDIWAIGGIRGSTGNQPLALHWDGKQWHRVPAPRDGGSMHLVDVTAMAPDDVWALGELETNLGGHTVSLHWDGSKWSRVATPMKAGGPYHLVKSGNQLWSVGLTGVGVGARAYLMRYDGTGWRHMPNPNIPNTSQLILTDGAATPDGLLAVGRSGGGPHRRAVASVYSE